ncbi:MAG: alpha/beta hydrolase [Wenzhouxiangella sp.]|nr:MAG: alpha/beta hydrolase [Wenzhouxiangella sp.]
MDTIRLTVNGLDFQVLMSGQSDRLVLMLHGFPDDARSFVPMMRLLNDAGYRCAAPFMRGYHPTAVPDAVGHSRCNTIQIEGLAADAEAITLALKARFGFQSCFLLGHDWGAIAAYAAVARRPDLFRAAVMMSVPPGPVFLRNLVRNPGQFVRSAYIFYFQLPWLPEWRIRAGNGRYIERLWQAWSGDVSACRERIEEVIETLSGPETLRAALAYYRGLLRPPPWQWRQWNQARRLLLAPAAIPSLVLAGEQDRCIPPAMFSGCEEWLSEAGGHYRTIADAGHFLPLEATQEVVDQMLRFCCACR